MTKARMGPTMPVDAPIYAKPPFYYRNVERLVFTYETDKEAALDILPDVLNLRLPATACVNFLNAPVCTLGAYEEAYQVKLFLYDAAVSEVQSLTSGIVQGLVAQEPQVEGIDAVQYAVAAAQGRTVPKILETVTQLLTGSSTVTELAKYEYQGSC